MGGISSKVVTLNTVLTTTAMEEIYFKLMECVCFYCRSKYMKFNLSLENTKDIKLGLECTRKVVILFLLLQCAEKNCIAYTRGPRR